MRDDRTEPVALTTTAVDEDTRCAVRPRGINARAVGIDVDRTVLMDFK